MPEYTSTLILLFILGSCFYQKHIRDWWWFRCGVICFLGGAALAVAGQWILSALSFFATLAQLAAIGALVMACIKQAEKETEHLRCLECGYILKGISEPRCPECGWQI